MAKIYGYPIAEWSDESSYPDPEKMTGPQMAWEYIRRNPEYQKDFLAWSKSRPTTTRTPLSPDDTADLYKKWFTDRGSYRMIDFLDNKPVYLDFRLKKRPDVFWPIAYGKRDQIVSPFLFKNDIGAVFNLDQKISPQIKDVQKFLMSEQKKRKIKPSGSGPQKVKHKLFWRLIDAKSQKVPNKEIRKIFKFKYEYPDVDQLKERLRQAHVWRDGDFIKLVNVGKPSLKRNPKAKK